MTRPSLEPAILCLLLEVPGQVDYFECLKKRSGLTLKMRLRADSGGVCLAPPLEVARPQHVEKQTLACITDIAARWQEHQLLPRMTAHPWSQLHLPQLPHRTQL